MREQIRRVVTGHNEVGEAILLSDDTVAIAPLFGDEMAGAVIWTSGSVPADNVDDTLGAGATRAHRSKAARS